MNKNLILILGFVIGWLIGIAPAFIINNNQKLFKDKIAMLENNLMACHGVKR